MKKMGKFGELCRKGEDWEDCLGNRWNLEGGGGIMGEKDNIRLSSIMYIK